MATPGRPSQERQVREQLLDAARHFFLQSPYSEVSTRQIASRAHTNVGMIRYYFGNKLGLFEAVLRDTLEPIRKLLRQIGQQPAPDSLEQVMALNVELHLRNPDFAKLMMFVMYCGNDTELQGVFDTIMEEINSYSTKMFKKLQQKGLLAPHWDIELTRLSMMSLVMYPSILPEPAAALFGVEQSEDFYKRLLEHNLKLLSHGLTAGSNAASERPGIQSKLVAANESAEF